MEENSPEELLRDVWFIRDHSFYFLNEEENGYA
jgi:hypothetical protein